MPIGTIPTITAEDLVKKAQESGHPEVYLSAIFELSGIFGINTENLKRVIEESKKTREEEPK